MNYKKAFTISIVLHALFFYHAMGFSKPAGHPPQAEKSQTSTDAGMTKEMIADKPVDVTLIEKPAIPDKHGELPKSKPIKPQTCKHFIGGIGIMVRPSRTDANLVKIDRVWPNYPAEAAGLQDGDWITNYTQIRGEIGQTINVNLIRNGIGFTIPIKRDKICLEDFLRENKNE